MHLLDRGQYADAWAMTSPHFQTFKSDLDWQKRQKALRFAYGSLENRNFRRVNYRESYYRSPDGQYAIVQFTSHFRNKSRTIETIVFDCSDETCVVQEYILR